jgi:UDP-2,3-diacylglucosamine hydrolase
MKKYYFISDAHLGAGSQLEESLKEQKLISFFKYIQGSENHLFIVGDFFDVWFEYRHAIPNYYFRVLKELSNLRDTGTEIDFITGNHDGWVNQFLNTSLDIRTHQKPIDLTLYDKKIYLAHGHGLLPKKLGDRLLKKMLEHPFNIFLYRLIPPDIGLPLAKNFSRLSRKAGGMKINPEDAKGWYIEFAKSLLCNGYDAVILGHTHAARILDLEGGQYINLGDWITHFSYAKLENNEFTLNFW